MVPASPAQTTGSLPVMYLMGITLITVPDVVLAQDKSFNPWWASEDKVLFAKSMVQAACLELPAVQTLVSYS